ncbi:MAG: hypothetical protein HYV26_02845 [Candidatus Hydrogenedentes bacterium]|nr:hypothetical protein [Candidatus Hydrogenedentota bacterium]
MEHTDELDAEIRTNYEAFQELLPGLMASGRGKYCLMRHGEVLDIFDTAGDAYLAGKRLFEDRLFSIQEITDVPIDLGFFSRAIASR